MEQKTIRTEVKTYRVDRMCDKCDKGLMIATGTGITRSRSSWEHKCNRCGHTEMYEDLYYPKIEYVDIEN